MADVKATLVLGELMSRSGCCVICTGQWAQCGAMRGKALRFMPGIAH